MTDGSRLRESAGAARLWSPLYRMRHVLGACAIAFALLVAFGALAPWPAAVVATGVAAAGWVGGWLAGREPPPRAAAIGAAAPPSPPPDGLIADVIGGLADPVVVLDRGGVVIALNAPASVLSPALRRGEPALFALRMPAVVEAIRRAGATGEVQRAEFSERVPVDRWYEAHVIPGALAGGDGRGLLFVTFHDLTPLRRVEEMRADFVANASHELRTPLAALSGFIDTLQGSAREDPAAREKFLAIMKAQAQRMARLIDDLLSLSRIELNAHIHPDTTVDLVAVVRQVVDSLQMLARERRVEVSVTGPDRQIVAGDRDEIIRVFENLVENALKYGGAGKRVDIKVEPATAAEGVPRGEAKVAVRDFGPGIAPEHLPRLTERFYRVDVGHSRAEGGTGLGLALVKHILTRHRGRLSIESTPGQGSTFTVHFPPLPGAAAEAGKSIIRSGS